MKRSLVLVLAAWLAMTAGAGFAQQAAPGQAPTAQELATLRQAANKGDRNARCRINTLFVQGLIQPNQLMNAREHSNLPQWQGANPYSSYRLSDAADVGAFRGEPREIRERRQADTRRASENREPYPGACVPLVARKTAATPR